MLKGGQGGPLRLTETWQELLTNSLRDLADARGVGTMGWAATFLRQDRPTLTGQAPASSTCPGRNWASNWS